MKLEFEIIVIDNASYDGSCDMVKNSYPNVKFIQGEINLGFAQANNLAFHHTRGECVLFLNPDTVILDNAIIVMRNKLLSIPDAGVIGCTLLNTDLTIQTSCIQSFPTILNQALDLEAFRKRFPRLRLWGTRALYEHNEYSEVDAISGACLMIKRDIFETVGMFSTDYFMYSEDVDLCYKVHRLGYLNYYTDHACVIHHGGKSSSNRDFNEIKDVMMRDSKSIFIRKFYGKNKFIAYIIIMAISALIRISIISIIMPFKFVRGDVTAWKKISKKWVNILSWSLKCLGKSH